MPRFATAAARTAVFVAIVWALALSFVLFEIGSVESLDFALARSTTLGLSRAVSESTTCEAPAGPDVEPAATGVSAPQARGGAWSLGLRLGWETHARQSSTVEAATLTELRTTIEALATLLGVPTPLPFTPASMANANSEFVQFLEEDAATTARRLAATYSPDVCRFYKLGALWGAAGIARAYLAGLRPIHAADIRHYATAVALPEALWRPMTEPAPPDGTIQSISAESQALTNAVTEYLMRE